MKIYFMIAQSIIPIFLPVNTGDGGTITPEGVKAILAIYIVTNAICLLTLAIRTLMFFAEKHTYPVNFREYIFDSFAAFFSSVVFCAVNGIALFIALVIAVKSLL